MTPPVLGPTRLRPTATYSSATFCTPTGTSAATSASSLSFKSGIENGRNGGPRLTDQDVADLHQSFVDITDSSGNLRLRIGRQEMEFGAGRLIGESEGLNIRRAFDGFRFTLKHGRWTWNSTLTHPVLLRPNTFSIPDHKQTEWGTGIIRARERGGWAFYYIGLARKFAAFNGKTGGEVRETFGSHLWDQGALLDYNTDLIFQTGTFGAGRIVAGAISTNAGATLHNVKWQPRFGFRFDFASGDSDRASNNVNTFNPLFPNPVYSSLSALLGPANITDLGPTIRLTINSKTAITPEAPFYWRSSLHDGIYGFAGNLIRPGNLSSARFVGVQPGLVVDRTYTPHFSSTVGYFRFFTGDFLIQTPPGRNVGYLYATITSRF
jgi:Alginate export